MEHDLAAVVIELEAVSACELGRDLGPAAHALALSIISARDPVLAGRLHEGAGLDGSPDESDGLIERNGGERPRVQGALRPFSAAMFTPDLSGRGPLRLREGQRLLLRITSVDAATSRVLTGLNAADVSEEVTVDGAPMRAGRIISDPREHGLAGRDSIAELTQARLLAAAAPNPIIVMRFLTPTRFHSRGRNMPLPLPELVFGSLLDRWNNVAPVLLPAETRAYAAEHLEIAGYRLGTRRVIAAGGRFIGFTGECRYETRKPDPYWQRVLDLLAAFAFYSGVGAKTSMGFGQATAVR